MRKSARRSFGILFLFWVQAHAEVPHDESNLFLAEVEPIKWQWTCKSMGYYEATVFPNGSFVPVKSNESKQIKIIIKEPKAFTSDYCSWKDKHDYYIELFGADFLVLQDQDICDQQITYGITHTNEPGSSQKFKSSGFPKPSETFKDRPLNAVSANLRTSRPISLILVKDDGDWRFILSSTNLETEKSARELRVGSTFAYDIKSSASLWMLTGECIMATSH